MKLLYRVIYRLSLALLVVLAAWAALFYVAIIDEVNDEVDDSLEHYSELIIVRALAGEELPSQSIGSNNQYFIREVTAQYASQHPHISYVDSTIYIASKSEAEPSRVLTTIFRDKDSRSFELTVFTPTIEKRDLAEAILYWIILLYALLLVVILLVNIGVLYRSLRPLYVLLSWLNDYKVGAENKPLKNETSVAEFKKLNEAAVRNMERAEQLFQEQQQFLSNASHELQTPLAICQNRLELLMEDETLTETQLEELSKTCQTLEHITRMNKSLLLLSKIDNGQFYDYQPVELNVLLGRYIDDFKDIYAYKDIAVGINDMGKCTVTMNESLASILVSNLLKNAFVHNHEQGRVTIAISSTGMAVKNTGVRYSLDKERIFERFYQGSKKEGSTGLGLAICRSICRLSGLKLRYSYRDEMHCFEILT